MPTRAQNAGNRRQGDLPLTRRRSLCVRCARPELAGHQRELLQLANLARSGLKRWQRAARFRRTLEVVKRRTKVRPASLERGSAATRTVVRSISSAARWNELTHISKINRR